MSASQNLNGTWKDVPTPTITAGGVEYAYRELGTHNPGPPVVFLVHLAAVLDNWDPRVVDGIAAKHHVVAFDNRGVGASSGAPAASIEQMAEDAITFIKAMGFAQVDLSKIHQPVLVANGDSDRMVPTTNTHDLARRLPNSDLIIYPDSGHGAVFQFHEDFVPKTIEFLGR